MVLIKCKHDKKTKDPVINSIRSERGACCLEVIAGKVLSGTGAAGASVVQLGSIYSGRFRVVAIGALIAANGTSEKAEKITFGYRISDYGAADVDAFGSIAMDTTAGDQWTAGDEVFKGFEGFDKLLTPLAEANAGTPTYDIGPGAGCGEDMGIWLSGHMFLTATKSNVALSTATMLPYVFLEYDRGPGVL